MRKILVALILLICIFPFPFKAQWAKSYGKADGMYSASAIRKAQDEGYIVTGNAYNLREKSESPSYYPPQDILVFNFSPTGDSQTWSYLKIPNLTESSLLLDYQELTFNIKDFKLKYSDWSEYVPWAEAATIVVYSLCPQISTKIIKKGAIKR